MGYGVCQTPKNNSTIGEKMKIGYYIHSLSIGGAETLVVEYLITLKEKGHHVFLITDQSCGSFLEKRILDNDIKIYYLDSKMPNSGLAMMLWKVKLRLTSYSDKINRIISFETPDVLHAHSSIARLAGISFQSNQIYFTIHSDVDRYLGMIKKHERRVLATLARNGIHFIVLTEMAKEKISSPFGST